jgi:hypothetical protein
MTGYRQALADGMTIVVKIDGDGQMDPTLMMRFVNPILKNMADYTKGNRFYNIDTVRNMPAVRKWGNAVLSFLSKLSTGYWNLFDPTNGYTAIHAAVLKEVPLARVSHRYFFESDLLFRLNIIRAKVIDVPMDAIYADEKSHLFVRRIWGEFLYKHGVNLFKRIFYNYFLRDFSLASLELVTGLGMLLFGVSFGVAQWSEVIARGVAATSGTVMLAALPVVLGTQLVLAFLAYDINIVPATPIAPLLLAQSEGYPPQKTIP